MKISPIIRMITGLLLFALSIILAVFSSLMPDYIGYVITILLLISVSIGTFPISKLGGVIYDITIYMTIWLIPSIIDRPAVTTIQGMFLYQIFEMMPLITVFLIIDLLIDVLRALGPDDSIFNDVSFDVINICVKLGLLYVAAEPLLALIP